MSDNTLKNIFRKKLEQEEALPDFRVIAENRRINTIRSASPAAFSNFYFMLDPLMESLPEEVEEQPYEVLQNLFWTKAKNNAASRGNFRRDAA